MTEEGINQGLDKLNDGNVHYRGVFVPA